MSRVLFIASFVLLILPAVSEAQIGFSRRQQAGMLAYQAQIRAKEQVRQQAALQEIQRQFVTQQSEINRQQFRSDALMDYLEAADPDNPDLRPGFRMSRRAQSFGDVHYTSPYFNRINPYYDRQFIQTRNRQLINIANTNSVSRGF